MTEKLLHFIWQNKLFNVLNLYSTENKKIEILQVGYLNKNQGPDFIQARICYENILWAGCVEIHNKSSDWLKHNHQYDTNFDPIILHVVWENDKEILNRFQEKIITLEIKNYVLPNLLAKYENMMSNTHKLLCYELKELINPLRWTFWKNQLIEERLERKAFLLKQLLNFYGKCWESTTWHCIAKQLAGPVNSQCFESLMKNTAYDILNKNRDNKFTLEAIILGQLNLLHNQLKDEYGQFLYKEFNYIKKKYNLANSFCKPLFLRMRPSSFPTIKASQLAFGFNQNSRLFTEILSQDNIHNFRKFIKWQAAEYWKNHYVFDEKVSNEVNIHLGKETENRLLINVVIPLKYTYFSIYHDYGAKLKIMELLYQIQAENNQITRCFGELGATNKNAFDSQSFSELYSEFCLYKKCLDCSIGQSILTKNK